MITQEQEANKFKNRRRMAWRSFYSLSIVGIAVLGFAFSSDAAAARVSSVSWVVTGLFGVGTTIILAYFGGSSVAEVWGKNDG